MGADVYATLASSPSGKDVENVPLLRPTKEDMANFGRYVEGIANDLDKFGAVSVQPPAERKPPDLELPEDSLVHSRGSRCLES